MQTDEAWIDFLCEVVCLKREVLEIEVFLTSATIINVDLDTNNTDRIPHVPVPVCTFQVKKHFSFEFMNTLEDCFDKWCMSVTAISCLIGWAYIFRQDQTGFPTRRSEGSNTSPVFHHATKVTCHLAPLDHCACLIWLTH